MIPLRAAGGSGPVGYRLREHWPHRGHNGAPKHPRACGRHLLRRPAGVRVPKGQRSRSASAGQGTRP
jgi:hypothetical protein